tara:strand:- start:372 stop:815 length:444 start_codon:yes stop_codon:yes gene_type:complete
MKINYKNLVIIFVITAVWDVILRFISEKQPYLFGLEKMKWITTLKKYFEEHTLLGAALIAGLVGSITYVVIMFLLSYFNVTSNLHILLITALVSGLIGIPMRYSGLFPKLHKYYYKKLGFTYSYITDTFSGIVVLFTFYIFNRLYYY